MIKQIADYVKPENATVLDYGCGNGAVAAYFRAQGAIVDMAEIAEPMASYLRTKYPGATTYLVNTPSDIPAKQHYDYVLCLNVFHHIAPEYWDTFLEHLHHLEKSGGHLIISGWYDSDYYISQNENIALATNRTSWTISDLVSHYLPEKWSIIDDRVAKFKYGIFKERSMRFYYLTAK